MQTSLDKVKHLIRIIQAFNFNKALAESDGKDVSARVPDRVEVAVSSEAATEDSSAEKVTDGSSSAGSNTDENDKKDEHGATGNNQTTGVTGGDEESPAVLDGSTDPATDNSPAAVVGVTGVTAGAVVRALVEAVVRSGVDAGTGVQAEVVAKPDTEAAPLVVDIPAPLVVATVATTNGTSEPACPDHSPAGGCTANNTTTTTNSENKMAAVNPAETAVEKKQEEIIDSDGSNNNNNSKTSEPSQHSLPALVSSLDDKK